LKLLNGIGTEFLSCKCSKDLKIGKNYTLFILGFDYDCKKKECKNSGKS
jgi:hypothetical protein